MPRVRFRFGNVDTQDIAFPSLELLADQARERGVVGGAGNRKGAREVATGEDYLYVRFVKEVAEEVQVFDEFDNIVIDEQYIARVMQFLLLENGNYAFQSRRGVNDGDALQYLFDPLETDIEFNRYDEFSLGQMRWFYKNRPKIRKLKLQEIGKREPNPHWPEDDIREIVGETGEEADNSIFSVGRKDNNLKNVEIIDRGFARLSDLQFIRARDAADNIQELLSSGRFGFTYPADLEEDEQAELIRDTGIGILRNLFGSENGDEQD